MIKTRILEKKMGHVIVLEPQYLKDVTTWFGLGESYQEWCSIFTDYHGFPTSEGEYPLVMEMCKKEIDAFLLREGFCKQVVHWYPEVQE